jgi:hypothetical protein
MIICLNEVHKRKFSGESFAAIFLVLMTLVTTTITSMPIARAQSQGPPAPGVLQGPPTFVGNTNDLSTEPPVPNCNAIFQGNFHGPSTDTMLGCK